LPDLDIPVTDRPNLIAQTADTERAITLGLLNAIQDDDKVTQRSVAKGLGIALGLANAYLKRCIKKGFVKVRQIPHNRYAYYLTPHGFAEKSRLTAEFLSQSFLFFREAREQYSALLADCAARGWTRLAFAGSGDLAEIAGLCNRTSELAIVAVIGDVTGAGSAEAERLHRLGEMDAVIVTDLKTPQETFNALAAVLPPERILTPAFLNIARSMPRLAMPDVAE
jgi:DNA-binding MarR family transcriptional regulator